MTTSVACPIPFETKRRWNSARLPRLAHSEQRDSCCLQKSVTGEPKEICRQILYHVRELTWVPSRFGASRPIRHSTYRPSEVIPSQIWCGSTAHQICEGI